MGLSAGYRTQVDHIDGNTLNNCRSNLRLCTQKENKQNIRLKSNSRSRIKGVYYDAARDRWQAYICVDKKKIHLGRHKTPEDAHMAYAAAARAYFGDFANLG
ncbi:AP2 domain-containing protein [Cupriavidus gilardii]